MTPEQFLASCSPAVRATALHLRALVREVLPEAEEVVFEGWKNLSYGTGESRADKDLICYVAPFSRSVNLGFYRGASLPDPHGLLKGTGAQLRHAKFSSRDQIDDAQVRALLLEARRERLGG